MPMYMRTLPRLGSGTTVRRRAGLLLSLFREFFSAAATSQVVDLLYIFRAEAAWKQRNNSNGTAK
jgi:hypothetical protein